ncbi:MAG: hypothetical protein KAS32_31410 [Candidatus Peribacteraceae bacterium]|nr:hypothetical protein [Candidatus Peribacteraceae bacterium]
MPNQSQKIDSFFEVISPLLKGIDNARSTTEITKVMAKKKGIGVGSPYSIEFHSLKAVINRWLKILNETKRIKRKAIPSDTPIDAYIYWVDEK